MSYISRANAPRLAATIGAALLATAVAAPAAVAAPTTVKAVNGTLYITAGSATTNAISVADEGGSYRVKELGSNASLTSGGGISYAAYSSRDWVVTATPAIKSVRIKTADLADAINTTGLTLPAALLGGSGNDILSAGSGRTTLSGSSGADDITGGSGDDTIVGGTGADSLSGNGGDDLIFAVDGSAGDTVNGGTGDDEAAVDGGDSISLVESIIVGD